MSLQSHAFIYYDVDNTRSSITDPVRTRAELRAPYYISGAITQVDQGVMSDGKSAGLALSALSIGKSGAQDVTNVSIDMGMFNKADDSSLTGVRTQNTIRIVKTGQARNIEGLLSFGSINYSVKSDRSEGSHQAIRTLIELSMIELVGKFTSVPYWRCLSVPSTDPLAQRAALKFFLAMTPASRISAVQTALSQAKENPYRGATDGVMTPEFSQAVSRYRVEAGLTPGTQVDFDLYYSMLNRNMTLAVGQGLPQPKQAPPTPAVVAASELDFALDTVGDVHARGEKLHVTLTPNRSAYFYCFMTTLGVDGQPSVMRLYPNQFSGAELPVEPGEQLRIPANDAEFSLRLSETGQETIACVARAEPYQTPLPSSVAVRPLTAFQLGAAAKGERTADAFARQIRSVVDQHQGYDRKALKSVVRVASVTVVEKAGQ